MEHTYHDLLKPVGDLTLPVPALLQIFCYPSAFLPPFLELRLRLFSAKLRASQLHLLLLTPSLALGIAVPNVQVLEALHQNLDITVSASMGA